jgi:hypothetical protein
MAPTPKDQNGILPRNNRDKPTSRSNTSAAAASAANMNNDPSTMLSVDHRRTSTLDNAEDPAQPTPLFERLVTEEVQELKSYVRIVENQNRRLAELERVHGDLEARLETESRIRQKVEATLEAREKEWAEKFAHIASDRDYWKKMNEEEKRKNARLLEQVVRKDQDIHRMLQRKVSGANNEKISMSCTRVRLNVSLTVAQSILLSMIMRPVDQFALPDKRSLKNGTRKEERVHRHRDLRRGRPIFGMNMRTKVRTRFLRRLGPRKRFGYGMQTHYSWTFLECDTVCLLIEIVHLHNCGAT